MRLFRALQTAIGLAAFGVLALVVVAPGLFQFPAFSIDLTNVTPTLIRRATATLIALTVLAPLLFSWSSESDSTEVDPLVSEQLESIRGRETRAAGADVDDLYTAAMDDNDTDSMEDLEARLRESAVSLYALSASCSRAEALEAVDSGTWTDDRRAAAFVGTDTEALPLRIRLWDFVRPGHPLERRVRHTVSALERLDAAGRGEQT